MLLFICFVFFSFGFYLFFRIRIVFRYRDKIIDSGGYDLLPSISSMIYSFRPLKDKYWLKNRGFYFYRKMNRRERIRYKNNVIDLEPYSRFEDIMGSYYNDFSQFINSSFIHSQSKEGLLFWDDISKKYK